MKNARPHANQNEHGNILFYILVAVILLAALVYAVAQSGRGSVKQVNDEKAKLIATEMIEYSNAIANAVAQLRLRGVKEADLCFDDPGYPSGHYTHASCSDNANKIFHLSGGGITWKKITALAMDPDGGMVDLWQILADNEIERVGTTCGDVACADLILIAQDLSLNVCKQLDLLLHVIEEGDSVPEDSQISALRYIGAYDSNAAIGDEAGGEKLIGKTAACFHETAGDKNIFYKVLIAR